MGPDVDEAVARIGDALRSAGYDEPTLTALLGGVPAPAPNLQRLGPLMRRTSGGSPLDTLVRLLLLTQPVDETAAAAAVAPTSLDDWVAAGLLTTAGGLVRATVILRPYEGLLVAADIARRPGAPSIRTDFVMGLSPSTLGMARLTVRRPCAATLDVGTGGGYQAMRAAAHSTRVVATDVNPRALWLAGVNLGLNGISNVELREGDLLAPVAGESFDLIVSNPPFIIGPDITHQFLASTREGDGVCRELAALAPAHLDDGGYCQFLANWVSTGDEPWVERMARWFGDECDVWVIRASVDTPDEYASTWIAAVTDDPDEYEQRYAAWMRGFDEAGVDAIAYGLVTMRRRRSGPPRWRRFDDVSDLFDTGTGEDIERLVEARTWVEATTDGELLGTRLRFSDSARVLLQMRLGSEGLVNDDMVLKRVDGLRFGAPGSPDLLRLMSHFDGNHVLAEVIASLVPDGDHDVQREILESARELVSTGLVEPVD